MNILKVKDSVLKILREQPITRDNDKLLVLKVWAITYPELRDTSYSFTKFSKIWLDGKLDSSESITRCRRKMQEQHVELIGNTWGKRHGELQDSVINQMIDETL